MTNIEKAVDLSSFISGYFESILKDVCFDIQVLSRVSDDCRMVEVVLRYEVDRVMLKRFCRARSSEGILGIVVNAEKDVNGFVDEILEHIDGPKEKGLDKKPTGKRWSVPPNPPLQTLPQSEERKRIEGDLDFRSFAVRRISKKGDVEKIVFYHIPSGTEAILTLYNDEVTMQGGMGIGEEDRTFMFFMARKIKFGF